MGKITGFLEYERALPPKRPVADRIKDYRELELPWEDLRLQEQGARCMDCGVPTCHQGCPLGKRVLAGWERLLPKFVKVMPVDYRRILNAERDARRKDIA